MKTLTSSTTLPSHGQDQHKLSDNLDEDHTPASSASLPKLRRRKRDDGIGDDILNFRRVRLQTRNSVARPRLPSKVPSSYRSSISRPAGSTNAARVAFNPTSHRSSTPVRRPRQVAYTVWPASRAHEGRVKEMDPSKRY